MRGVGRWGGKQSFPPHLPTPPKKTTKIQKMTKEQIKFAKIPDTSGVYFFLGEHKKIIYIGKATSLRNRVRSYFSSDIEEKRSLLISKMVEEAKEISFTKTDSVLEALILETNLIQSHKPHYNTRSKDDKSYNHLIITNEEWPRVLLVRERDLLEKFQEEEIKYTFGPFTSSSLLREALKIIRKLFKFYDTKIPIGKEKSKLSRGKIDFNRQIGLYPEENNRKNYLKTIRQLKLFFQGKKQQIIKELEKEMLSLAKKEKFEEAGFIKRKIFALKHIEDISLIKDEYRTPQTFSGDRIEAYDVAHMQGKSMVGVMTVVVGGEAVKSEYRKFKLKTVNKPNDPAALREIFVRRLKHSEWPIPKLIVVDGNEIQKKVVEDILEKNNLKIIVAAVTKDDKHRVKDIIAPEPLKTKLNYSILLANAEAHRFAINYYRNLARKKLTKN